MEPERFSPHFFCGMSDHDQIIQDHVGQYVDIKLEKKAPAATSTNIEVKDVKGTAFDFASGLEDAIKLILERLGW